MAEVSFAAKAPSAVVVDIEAKVTQVETPKQEPTTATVTGPVQTATAPAAPTTTTALVPHKASAPMVFKPANVVSMDRIPGFEEIIWPRLNVAQAIGDLGKQFPVGSVIHNQSSVLFEPTIVDPKTNKTMKAGTPPIRVVCLGFLGTRYVEKVVGGGRGEIVRSEQAVRDAGGTLDYAEWNLKKDAGMKRFEVLEEALMAIERPDHMADDDSVFVFPVEGKKYALAIYGMKGTAYTAAAKGVLFTQRVSGCLRDGYPTRVFAMSTRWKDFPNGNGAWVPVLLAQEATTPAFRAWVQEVTNPQAVAAAEGAAQA